MTLADGLDAPTAVAYAPDCRLFIAEKPGRLRVVSAEGGLRATPVLDISSHVNDHGDRGLLGLALDASFATNGLVYLLYANDAAPDDASGPKTLRLVRIRVFPDNSVESPANPEAVVVVGSIGAAPCLAPADTSDCIPSDGDSHSIGTVQADTVGTLWLGSGDASSYNFIDPTALRTYDERSMAGKILHVDRDGHGLRDTLSAPPRPISTSSARSSTPRAFATRSASSCARTGLRSSATSAGTRARSSTWCRRDGATAGRAGKDPSTPPATAT